MRRMFLRQHTQWEAERAMSAAAHMLRYGSLCLAAFAVFLALAMSGGARIQGLMASPPAVNFGSQNIGTRSEAGTVTLTNTGPTSATIANIVLTGAYYGDFTQTN